MGLGAPCEAWLKGGDTDADHERYGLAMAKCQHGGAYCASDGFCHYDGDCFRSAKSSKREAVNKIRCIMTDSSLVKAWLNDAANWLEKQ